MLATEPLDSAREYLESVGLMPDPKDTHWANFVIAHDFRPLFILFILFIFLPFKFNFITLIPFKKNTNDLIRWMSSNGAKLLLNI